MIDKDTLRRDRNLLIEALREAGAQFKGSTSCLCPFHDDRAASGSIHADASGIWRFTCHGCKWGGDVFDVQSHQGGKSVKAVLGDIRRKTPAAQPRRATPRFATPKDFAAAVARIDVIASVETFYAYTNPQTGRVEMIVVRAMGTDGKKTFRQGRPTDDGKAFEWGGPAGLWPLYNRTRIKAAHTVVVVEGEKCVHAITPFLPDGYAATTNPGGAGERKSAKCDWSPLSGKRVIVWPDNDLPDPRRNNIRQGIEHMNQVCAELAKLPAKPMVTWIDPDDLGLEARQDAVDYLVNFGGAGDKSRDALGCAFKLGRPVCASRSLHQHILDTIAGKTLPLKLKWKQLHRMTKLAMPGTIALVCGDPGSTKSYLVLEQFWTWHQEGVKVALYELEEDEAYWLSRVQAQVAENAKLDDREWVNRNGKEAIAAYLRHQSFFDSFAPRLFTAPGTREIPQVTQDDLVKWARLQAEQGCRVIGIDPVTMAAPSAGTERSFTPDLKFLVELKLIAREFGCSIILVTHPKESLTGGKKSPIDNLAGGKAYARFAQTILWVCRYPEPKEVRVEVSADEEQVVSVERYIQNVKTRNGKEAGLDIAFIFEPSTLRFTELGMICRAGAKGSPIVQTQPQDPFGDSTWVRGEGGSADSPLAAALLGPRAGAPVAPQRLCFDDETIGEEQN